MEKSARSDLVRVPGAAGADPSGGACACLRREFSGEPDAGNLHLRFDEGIVSRTRREARCCTEDEGRPLGAALWEEASNCRKLLRSKAAVVNVSVKRRGFDHVMCGIERRMQMNLR